MLCLASQRTINQGLTTAASIDCCCPRPFSKADDADLHSPSQHDKEDSTLGMPEKNFRPSDAFGSVQASNGWRPTAPGFCVATNTFTTSSSRRTLSALCHFVLPESCLRCSRLLFHSCQNNHLKVSMGFCGGVVMHSPTFRAALYWF